MKTLLTILLFATSLCYAQPAITNPTPYGVCDNNNDGFSVFNLTSKNAEILGSLLAANHTVSYHETFTEATIGVNPLVNNYSNINPFNQVVYVRVIENSDPANPSTAVLELVVNQSPVISPIPVDVIACESYTLPPLPSNQNYYSGPLGSGTLIPAGVTITSTQTLFIIAESSTTPICYAEESFQVAIGATPTFNTPSDLIQNDPDGTAVFDLASQITSITTNPSYIVQFYSSFVDAQNGTNTILTPTSYVNFSNPQTIGVTVTDSATGCSSITSFQLIVNTNPFPINNPTPLIVCDNNNDGIAVFNIDSKNAEILGSLSSSQYTVTYYENQFAAQLGGFGNILSPYFNINPYNQTVYARVELNSDSSIFSTTSLQLIVNPIPTINTPVPNLTVYENPTDGVAVFDLTVQTPFILNGDPTVNVLYYTTQINALNQTNPIVNSTNFTGNNNQVIWVNAQNSTGCFAVASFVLNVTNSSNIIIFSDSNFKAKLLTSSPTNQVAYSGSGYVKIDANNDNEIQFTEAAVIDSLDVRFANIIDVTGINGFSNLKRFDCSNNQIVTLNLTSINTLIDLFCTNNAITTLSINGLSNLQNLICQSNYLSSIDVSTNTNLRYLDVMNNTITALNTSNLTLLEYLDCRVNQLNTINVNSNVNLKTLYCSYNLLTSLNVSTLTLLEQLYCYNNQLNNIQFGANTLLYEIHCYENNLTSLNTSTFTALTSLDCSNNQITALDVSQNLNLNYFNCANNALTTLDCSMNTNLTTLSILSNPNLQTLFIKNGVDELNADSLLYCPNLTYICADDNQIPTIAASYPLITINSFCTFNPGGNFNTITGTAIIDGNNNGCSITDAIMPYLGLNVSLNGISTTTSVYTNGLGIYNLFTTFPGIYQLTANLENSTYFNVSSVEVDSNTINDLTILQNICITPNGIHPDIEVVLAPVTPARPGFNASYELVYKNKGNQTLSGTVTLNYNDSVLDYVSTTTAPASQTTGVINWNYSNLQPFENRSIGLVLNVNSPVETPAVNIGDILNFTSTITPVVADEIPTDNTFTFSQTVVGSYDPNDITCLQGDTVSPSEIGNFLHYVINFENTGTYYAENVVVQDIIDTTQYDISSLQILNASHNMDARINGNKVEFVFQNINLAAVAGNPPVGGHGNVLFKIRSKSNLVTGAQVVKKASIFFDYNAPIITNDAETTYTSLNNGGFNPDDSLSVYPNPTSSILNITSDNTIEAIELYDIQGRILEKSFQSSNAVILDISNRQSGIYFLKITSDRGSKVEKIVKK